MATHSFLLTYGRTVKFNDRTCQFTDSEQNRNGVVNEFEVLELVYSLSQDPSAQSWADVIGEQVIGAVKIGDKYVAFDYCLGEGGPNEYKVFASEIEAIAYTEDTKQHYNDNSDFED